MKIMENKLFYAGLVLMVFGALLGRGFSLCFGFILLVADFLERQGMLRPLARQIANFLASCGGLVADAVSGRRGSFLKLFSRICIYIFSAVIMIALARIWQNNFTLFLGVVGMAMLWIPPVAMVTYFAAKHGWKTMTEKKKEKEKC